MNVLKAQALPSYGTGANRREWLHVDNRCRAIAFVLRRRRVGETCCIGSGERHSIEGVADAVLAAADRPTTLKRYVECRLGHDRLYLLDPGAARG